MLIPIDVNQRQSGRTERIVEWARKGEVGGPLRYIVCHSKREANRLFHDYNDLDDPKTPNILMPLTWQEAERYCGAQAVFAIDNLDLILYGVLHNPVDMVSWEAGPPRTTRSQALKNRAIQKLAVAITSLAVWLNSEVSKS